MARTRPAPRDFGTGELAPWLDGIVNEITARGLLELENWIVRKTGAAIRRPGTRFVREVKDSNDATLVVPVEIDTTNSFVLEVGDVYIRFYQQSTHAVIGAPYEVVSPWSTGELSDLRWQYIPEEKAVYWTHPLHAMRKLAFTSAASWTLGLADLWLRGPVVIPASDRQKAVMVNGFHNPPERILISSEPGDEQVVYGITHNGQSYHALAYDYTITSGTLLLSDDGRSWLPGTTPAAYTGGVGDTTGGLAKFAVNEDGKIMLAGMVPTGTVWATMDNGLTWDSVTVAGGRWNHVAWLQDNDTWRVIARTNTTTQVAKYSEDNGFAWTTVTMPATMTVTERVRAFIGANNLWVAAFDTGKIITASGGAVAAPFSLTHDTGGTGFFDVCYGEPEGSPLWVAVGSGGILRTSSDALTWATGTTFSRQVQTVLWTGNRFIGIAGTASGGYYYHSDNGTSWMEHAEADWATQELRWLYVTAVPPIDREQPMFNESGKYPSDLTFHEGRLVIGATVDKPATVWGSKSGDVSNFYLGNLANNAFEYSLGGERNVDIQWLMGGPELVAGTRTEEITLRGEAGLGITPNGVQALKQSTFGSDSIKPVRIHDTIVFVQRGGEVIRGYVPAAGTGAWQSPDLTYHAGHITKGSVLQLAHQDDPQTILYAVRNDGELLALTYHPPNVVAWSRIVTDGTFEWIAVVPTSGAEDEIWAVVKRTVNGVTKRYIEYFDPINVASLTAAHYVDCGVSLTQGATFATMGSLTHLAGETVDVLIDGNEWLSGFTVAASGTIVFTTGYSGTTAHAGLPYTSKLETMRGDWGSPWGSGAGLSKYISRVLLWVNDSLGGFMGPTFTLATEAVIALSSTATLETDVKVVNFPGQHDYNVRMWVKVTQPTPFEIIGLLPDVETGDR